MDGDPDFSRTRNSPRFDPTINLGHILTAMGMLCALLTMWTNMKVTTASLEARVAVLEKQNTDIATSQAFTAKALERLTVTLEFLSKQQSSK